MSDHRLDEAPGEGTVADTAIARTVWPPGEDPLKRAVWRLRSRGCWGDAAALLAPLAAHHPGAALRQAELFVERCAFTSESWEQAEEALRTAESRQLSDEERGAAACERGYLAYVATELGVRDRTDEARSALGRAAALLDPESEQRPLLDYRRGLMAQYLSDSPRDAEASYRRAHTQASAHGDLLLCSATWRQLGFLASLNGELDEAREAFAESLRLREDIGFLVGIAPALTALSEVQPKAQAERLRGEAARLFRLLGGIPRWLAPQLRLAPAVS